VLFLKLLKRILPVVLSSLLIIQAVPAYALTETNAELTNLTVPEATRRAIDHNESIKKSNETEDLSDDKYTLLRESARNATTEDAVFTAYTNLLQFELSRSLNIKNIKAQEENVEHGIIQIFNNILNAEEGLAVYDENLKLTKKELDITFLKLGLGLASQFDYDSAKAAYENMLIQRNLQQSGIDKAYRQLNETMGQDLNKKYNLVLNLDYELLGEVNLTTYASKFIANSLAIKQAKDDIQVAQYALDTHTYNYDPYTGLEISAGGTKQEKEMDLSRAKRNLTSTEESVKKSVIDTYNSIKDLELKIASQEIELENLNTKLDIAQKRLELGQVTQLSVDKLLLEKHNLEYEMETNKNDHAILIMAFKNPNIIASASAGSAETKK